MSAKEIADLSGVSRAAVANWARRHSSFPSPSDRDGRSALYERSEVLAWLRDEGKLDGGSVASALWSVADVARPGSIDHIDLMRVSAWALALDRVGERIGDASSFSKSILELFDVEEGAPGSWDAGGWEQLRPALEELITAARREDDPMTVVDAIGGMLTRRHELDMFGEPIRLQELMARLASHSSGDSVYDPALGSGRLLIRTGRSLNAGVAYGQDISTAAVGVAQAFAGAAGMRAEVRCGDTLRDDMFPSLRVDDIVTVPPFGMTLAEPLGEDPRWRYGTPQGDAFWGFAQHCISHLNEQGRAVIAAPWGALEKSGPSGRIRERLARAGVVKAVFRLGTGWLDASGIQIAILVLGPPPTDIADIGTVLMCDVTDATDPSALMLEAMEQEGSGPFRAVGLQELADNEFGLDPRRYLDRQELLVDLDALFAERQTLGGEIALAYESMTAGSTDRPMQISAAGIARGPRRSIGTLVDEGALELVHGRHVETIQTREEGSLPVLTVGDLVGRSSDERWTTEPVKSNLITQKGDTVIVTAGSVGASLEISDNDSGRIPQSRLVILRIPLGGEGRLTSEWLRLWLRSPDFSRQIHRVAGGSQLTQVSSKGLRQLTLPLPSIESQLIATTRLDGLESTVRETEDLVSKLRRRLEVETTIAIHLADEDDVR